MQRSTDSSTTGSSDSGYIPTLDGWRGIAIILVLAAHYAMALHSKYPFLYSLGGIGVSVFFGISGFLICTLLLRGIDKQGSISLGNFYRKRTFRIFPVAYVFLLTILALRPFLQLDIHNIWSAFLFVRNYVSPANGMTQHFWSLAVEEHFYLILPGLMLFAKGRKLLVALAIGSALIFLWRYEAMRIWTVVPDALYRTDFRLDSILDGSIVASMVHDKQIGSFLRRLRSLKIAIGAMALLVLSHLCHNLSLSRSLVAIAIPFILLSTIWATESIPFHLLEWAPLRWVGRLSYSIYIWQGLFTANGSHLLGGNRLWFINLIGIVGVSMLSFYCLEQPLIRLGRKKRSTVGQVAHV